MRIASYSRVEHASARGWCAVNNSHFPTWTICGSMRFHALMLDVAADESKAGHIVLFPFVVIPPDEQVSSETKRMLDEMHFAKIDASVGIIVVTVDRYVGISTRNEIRYAILTKKAVRFHNEWHHAPLDGPDIHRSLPPVPVSGVR